MDEKTVITICMGSSCFSRGNNRHLAIIQEYLKRHDLDARVQLVGSRCEKQCLSGPNILIDGILHSELDERAVIELLDDHFLSQGKGE